MLIIALGLLSCFLSIILFPPGKIDLHLVGLALVTIFLSSHLHFQLPETKIHLSMSDALIFLALMTYGGGVAVPLAFFEALYTSFQFRKKGINIKPKTLALNCSMITLSTFLTTCVLNLIFSSVTDAVDNSTMTTFILYVGIMVVTQFFSNSIFVAVLQSKKSGTPIWQVWNESCVNVFVMYIAGAIIASLMLKVVRQTDLFLLLVAIAIGVIVYLTYRRYVNEIRETSAVAEQAERERAEAEKLRAEQAEKHIEELNHYIAEQERISIALRESKERFRHAAFHDSLTDLPNRNLFSETLRFSLKKPTRH